MSLKYEKMESGEHREEGADSDEGTAESEPDVTAAHVSVHTPQKPSYSMIAIAVLVAALLLMTALFLLLGILYGVSVKENSSSTESDVCQSEACFELSVQIQGAMEETVNPCEDFYNFTCGNWDTFNHITQGSPGYTTLSLQRSVIADELADVLESPFTDGNRILSELQELYDSCIVKSISNGLQLEPFRQLYQQLGGWSVVNIPGDGSVWGINSIQFIREKALGSPAFYTIDTYYMDQFTPSILRIYHSGLTMKYLSQYSDPNATRIFREQIIEVLTFVSKGNTTAAIEQAADEIVEFETNLAQISDTGDYTSTDLTVDDLPSLWPDHDWLNVLKALFSPAGVDLLPSDKVRVESPDYFRNLTTLIRNTPIRTLENYAKWQLAWKLQMVFNGESVIGAQLNRFRELVLGEPTQSQRAMCVSLVEDVMPIALARVYAQHILPSGYKEATVELISQVREGLRQRMMEVDWLDEDTRQLTIEKLDAIEARVAYPDRTFEDDYLEILYGEYDFKKDAYIDNKIQHLNISQLQNFAQLRKLLDRTKWFTAPTEVNANYLSLFNQISILEGIMHIPVFDKDWPLSFQYGSLGAILGHELVHGFDNNGRQYDKDGRKRMWWTETAVKNFKDRTQCFVDQYSNFELFGISVNGSLTLGENIADNGGLKASYNAYRRNSRTTLRLPGLFSYTNDQLFFIAFGQLWCSYDTPQSFKLNVQEEHSPNPFRVLGTLMNNADFAEAFNCRVGSPMNPQDKCLLW